MIVFITQTMIVMKIIMKIIILILIKLVVIAVIKNSNKKRKNY